MSPLDSLYSGRDDYRKTGKGYGMQNFKIPKIKKEEEEEVDKDVKDVKVAEEDVEKLQEPEVKEVKEPEVKDVKEPEPKPSTSEATEVKEPEVDESASANVSSSTECENKESEAAPEAPKEQAEVGEISSTNDIQENQTRDEPKLDDQSQTDIINKFLKKLLENERTRAAASMFIDNVSNSLDDEKLKMVVQTVKSAAVEEESQKKVVKKKRLVKKTKLGAKLATKRKQAMKKKLRLRNMKNRRVIRDDDEDEEEEEEEEEEKEEEEEEEEEKEEEKGEVVVSVGERIKSRKRVAACPKRKKARHKTELDMLHEDIQDMFIRDGVLTATGKRMCRLLKDEKNESESKPVPPPEPPKQRRTTRSTAEKFDSKANSEKLKVMSNVKVLLSKIPVDKLGEIDEDGQRYSLRKVAKPAKGYAEVDSEDEKEKEKEKERERQLEKEREREKEKEKEKAKEKEKLKEKEKTKEKAKEKVKKKEVSDEEPEEKSKEEKEKSPKKMKKRGNAWASGILPKRRKKTVEEKEAEESEADKSFELVEPDKEYFSSKIWHFRAPCKLCSYNGINITKHYRTEHPESEVLSSRLSPEKAEEAIKVSRELKLDDRSEHALLSTKKFMFTCRFCDMEMNSKPMNFYDHISTHTGEYRHVCKKCNFSSSNSKMLKDHYMKEHNTESYERAASIKTRVYGYICVECNFVQVKKKTVEDHVNVYHLGEGKKILKVHLSSLDDKLLRNEDAKKEEEKRKEEEKVDEESESEDSDDSEPEPEPEPKRKKVAEPEPEPKRKKPEPPALKPIKKEKEIDMTVFTCNTDIQEENEKIEQERLKKMTELNESVKTNRQSLNFVDQLSNRLLQEEKETRETPMPEVVTVKSEPMDTDFLPETEPEPEPEPEPELTPKKPTKTIETPVPAPQSVVPKKDMIEGMIQKLKGILKEEKPEPPLEVPPEGPPPLAPLLEKPIEEAKTFLSAGFLNIRKYPNGLDYACRVPSCLFTTTNRAGFIAHWNEDHTRINQSFKVTKCRICSEEVTATVDSPLLSNFFAHVENEHLCGILSSINAGLINVDRDRDGYEYGCRIPDCMYSTKERDVFIVHLDENHSHLTMTKCGICQETVLQNSEGNLLRNLLDHIETEHLVDFKEKGKAAPRRIIKMRRLSGDKLSTKTEAEEREEKEEKEEEENPFGFKISGVMSLADEQVPPLSPIKEKRVESVVLKEAKLTALEKVANWKCPEAFKKFLNCTRELYKCPQFFCKYATSWRHLFDNHTKAHARVSDELACCVYCDVKTPLSHAGLHIDLRHSNCLYSCAQCLYRAVSREYVIIHNRLKHKESDQVVTLPPKTAKTIMMSKQKMHSVKDTCSPYLCGNTKNSKDCNAQFLFLNEFISHLQKQHDGLMTCGYPSCTFKCMVVDNLIEHWRGHQCFYYNCLICKFGGMEHYTMLEHYAVNHPNVEPVVVDRRNSPNNSQLFGYTEEAFSKIPHLKNELMESVNVQFKLIPAEKKRESPKPPADSPKNVTLVPLQILQPNSTEPKKIYAIIPSSKVDGNIPKPLQILTSVPKESPPAAPSPSFVFAAIPPQAVPEIPEEAPKEGPVEESEPPTDNAADPLSLDGEISNMASPGGDESDSQDVSENPDLKSFGLIGYQLYRCAFCDISFSNARDFKAHTMHSKQCRQPDSALKPFRCVHCDRLFKNAHGLLEHIQYHGQLRFSCSLCVQKFPSTFSLKFHMRNKHNVTNTMTTPLVPNKTNLDRDEFVLRPVPVTEREGSKEPNVQLPGVKTTYGPEDVDQLPKRYIFNYDVKCALCPYSTKVRTNLVRHLQFHSSEKSVPEIAPVNPVPCLDKNERMFDKMTNLAISSMSNSSRMGGVKLEAKVAKEEHPQVPAYVPSNRRYVCCAEGCNYLCLEDSILRHHLFALHVQEPSFTCAHCKSNLKVDIEGFLKHLKLHDLHLYKCSACPFVHNLRHKVEKHASDKHPEKTASTITIRAMEAEKNETDQSASGGAAATSEAPPPNPNIKWTKPWHCGMCKYRCAAKNDIVTHIFNKHDINTQFKCTLCSYKTDEKHTFQEHFKENHPDNDIDIINVYYKSEGAGQATTNQKQFDTTPLWQRDRPRVRHIRGILFEETSPQKVPKKGAGRASTSASISTPTTSSSLNLDLAIDAVAKGVDETAKSKEVEKEDVIVIVDDDEEEGERPNDSGDTSLLIDIEGGVEAESIVKKEASREFLSEEILFDKYGKLCAPVGKTFKCPICLKSRMKKISYFVYHLLTELKCYRYTCKICDHPTITLDSLIDHCHEKHGSLNVVDIPMDKTVEYWLQILLQYQAKVLAQQIVLPQGEDPSSLNSKSKCEYCSKSFKSVASLKEHELYHWATNVYTCLHCCTEFQSLNELFQHNFMSHPSFDISFVTSGPYVSKVITGLKNIPTNLSEEAEPNEDTPPQGEEPKAVVPKKIENLFSCAYCHERDSEKALQEHHQVKHKGLKFSVYQFICLECSETFLNIKELRGHFTKSHPRKKLTYSCVENKPGGATDQFCCKKCPFRSCTVAGIRSHLRKHLRPIDCLICGATFIYPTEGRAHHNKEHPHSAERIEENKERVAEYEESVKQIVAAQEKNKGVVPRKMLARKSTGAPFVRDSKKESTEAM